MIAAPIQNGISQMPLYKKSPGPSNHQQMQGKRKEAQRKRVQVTSLQDLISKLYSEFDKSAVDVEYVKEIMTAYKSAPSEWKKYAKFDRYRYTRNLVDSGNGKFNLMILCWGEGHGSAIHDHADSHCFMKILDGTLSEVRFSFPEEEEEGRSASEGPKLKEIGRANLEKNAVCYINVTARRILNQDDDVNFKMAECRLSITHAPRLTFPPDSLGLHRVENPSHANPAVSLHLYCPPFDACSVFNQQTGKRTRCPVTFWSKYGEPREKRAQERMPEDN